MRIWPWNKGKKEPSPETVELREKLEQVRSERAGILELHQRAHRILTENHLAADIRRALGS